jgi:mitochondrial chaperone BCS1
MKLFSNLPKRCGILLHDIDHVNIIESGSVGSKDMTGIPLSELLNAIDEGEGRLLIMTANDSSRLPKPLVRPGRIDRTFLFDNATPDQARSMFCQAYRILLPDAAELQRSADSFAATIPDGLMSLATIQTFLLGHKEDPERAIERIETLVAENKWEIMATMPGVEPPAPKE